MYLHQSSDLILKKLHVQRCFYISRNRKKKSYSQHFTSTLNFYLKNLHFARGYIYKFSTANSRRKNNTERRESPFLIYYATSHSSQFARRWQGLNYYSPQNPPPSTFPVPFQKGSKTSYPHPSKSKPARLWPSYIYIYLAFRTQFISHGAQPSHPAPPPLSLSLSLRLN